MLNQINMNKVLCIAVFLLSTATWSQVETADNDSLKTKNIELYREMFWNNPLNDKKWVTDYEKLYTDDQKAELNTIIDNFEKETSFEIAIVTIDTLKVSREKFEDLSLHIAKTWGVGKRYKDNGILIAISDGYRKMRIQNGNGIERILTDEETQLIVDNYFIPEFKKGSYFNGTLVGLKEIIRVLKSKM